MDALWLGICLGVAAGVSPGPLMMIVISSALRYGWPAGVAAAFAPLVSDAVVVAGVLLVLDRLPAAGLPLLGTVGGFVVIWLGITTVRESRTATLSLTDATPVAASLWTALRRATMINFLSPHPWLAWATALGPLTLATWDRRPPAAVALLIAFYAALVGAKAVVAVLVAAGRRHLSDAGYRRTLVVAGVLLCLTGVALVAEFASQVG